MLNRGLHIIIATILFVCSASILVGKLSPGAAYRSMDGSSSLKIISGDELEFTPEKSSPNWICKYSVSGDSLRIVATVFGSPQAIYMKIIPEGLEESSGRKLLDEAHYQAAASSEKQVREQRERERAAAIAALPKPSPTPAVDKPIPIYAPRPDYPYEARRSKITGSGVVSITIDTSSGFVVSATMAQSTGSPILDSAITSTFRQWRFKPGNYQRVLRMPITMTMSGAQY